MGDTGNGREGAVLGGGWIGLLPEVQYNMAYTMWKDTSLEVKS